MRTIVGVLRGGPSSEYEVSLKSGAAVLSALNSDVYEPRDIFIDRSGHWHSRGVAMPPEKALRGVDVAFNALHGEYGEDGTVQRMLDILGVPYTGSGTFASAISFNKQKTKDIVRGLGIKVVHDMVVSRIGEDNIEKRALQIFRSFPMPAVVKPIIGGSSVGVTIARDFQSLIFGLQRAFEVAPKALLEEYIKGREATVGVIDDFRGKESYVLLPVEIVPPSENGFYDYHAKYVSDETNYLIPGNFSKDEKKTLMDSARRAHKGLGVDHYSRSDFIVSPRGVYFLEINTLPGMTSHSLIPKALDAVGSSFPQFLDHVISLARK